MSAYYNEHDKFAAAWLRELIREGLIADGHVDERDIQDVRPDDLRGFNQCHFFAGIGGWSLALRLAGWPDDRPVWSGSCPCQPYSSAGKGEGAADARNLWPAWFRLIRECRPVAVFGEQVEAAVRHGWLDAVSSDLEAEDYAVGSVVLGAHSVGAPHIRQRLWWVADSERDGLGSRRAEREGLQRGATPIGAGGGSVADSQGGDRGLPVQQRRSQQAGTEHQRRGEAVRLADPAGSRSARTEQRGADRGPASEGLRDAEPSRDGASLVMADPDTGGPQERRTTHDEKVDGGLRRRGLAAHIGPEVSESGRASFVGDSNDARSQGRGQRRNRTDERAVGPTGLGGHWADSRWHDCRDGKRRPVPTEPALFPLAARLPNRVGTLRGSGNAICPEVGAQFIRAYLETTA